METKQHLMPSNSKPEKTKEYLCLSMPMNRNWTRFNGKPIPQARFMSVVYREVDDGVRRPLGVTAASCGA